MRKRKLAEQIIKKEFNKKRIPIKGIVRETLSNLDRRFSVLYTIPEEYVRGPPKYYEGTIEEYTSNAATFILGNNILQMYPFSKGFNEEAPCTFFHERITDTGERIAKGVGAKTLKIYNTKGELINEKIIEPKKPFLKNRFQDWKEDYLFFRSLFPPKQ